MTFKLYFMAVDVEQFVSCNHNIVTDGVMILGASNQVLLNVWPYHFYNTTLSTE